MKHQMCLYQMMFIRILKNKRKYNRMKVMKKIAKLFIAGLLSAGISMTAFAQGITTASAYFKTVSEYYASIKDYEANFDIKADKQEMSGKLSYKKPDLLRMDFDSPSDQVI